MMPLFEIPVAFIINDTVVVAADTADEATAIVTAVAEGTVAERHEFMADQDWHGVSTDVDVLQIMGPATETPE